ncbi:MAG: hypothetical protein LBV43_06690 [Prevotella sp.]|nr:hypothetical protein [Prevotella sp.]
MLTPDQLPKARLIYYTGCASIVLGCKKETIKDIFPHSDYYIIHFCDRKNDTQEISIKIKLEDTSLVCYFDEKGLCNACYLYFDHVNDIFTYTEICSTLFTYHSATKLWTMRSAYIRFREEDENKYLIFLPYNTPENENPIQ